MPARPLVWLALAWLVGIVAADALTLPDDVLVIGVVTGLSSAVLLPKGKFQLFCFALVVASLGGIRYEPVSSARQSTTIWQLIDQGSVAVEGVIHEEPRWSEEGQYVVLRSHTAWANGEVAAAVRHTEAISYPVSGLLLLILPPYPAYHYGQQLVARGELRAPPAARHPNLFDYRDYLARKRIFALMRDPQVEVLPGYAGNPWLRGLLAFRTRCHTLILRGMPEPQASIASGMLLGLKATISDEVYQVFNRNGISHMLVISGWHFSFVAALVTAVVRRMRIGVVLSFGLSIAALWMYALFVGATPTVLRAALMASLVVLATATERQTEPWTLLSVACWVVTLWEPYLLWDLGFQLSVLATAGIFAFQRPLQRWFEQAMRFQWAPLKWVSNALSVTLAAQILALPLILYHTGNLSLISPISNVLLTPLVPIVMLSSAVALGVGLVASGIELLMGRGGLTVIGEVVTWGSQVVWLYAWLPLAMLTTGAHMLAQLPGAAIRLPPFSVWGLIAYYVGVGGGWGIVRAAARMSTHAPPRNTPMDD